MLEFLILQFWPALSSPKPTQRELWLGEDVQDGWWPWLTAGELGAGWRLSDGTCCVEKDQGSPSSNHALCHCLPSSSAQVSPWAARNECAKCVWSVLGVQTPLMKACSFPWPQCGKCPWACRDHSQLLSTVPTHSAGVSAREIWFEKPLLWSLLLAG